MNETNNIQDTELQNIKDQDMKELLKLRKKKLRIDRAILILAILIVLLLLFILFGLSKRCNCNCSCADCTCCRDHSTGVIRDNIIRLFGLDDKQNVDISSAEADGTGEAGTYIEDKDITGRGADSEGTKKKDTDNKDENEQEVDSEADKTKESRSDDSGSSGDDPDDRPTETIRLSSRDESYSDRPFEIINTIPGDENTKKYAIEVNHRKDTDLMLSLEEIEVYDSHGSRLNLDDIRDLSDSVLDIIKLKIEVEGTGRYDGSLKDMLDNVISYPLYTGSSTDTTEYLITVAIPSDVEDNYSDDTDGNYQNMVVNFSLMWWIE